MTSSNQKHYVGIDISKPILDVMVLPQKKYVQIDNSQAGIKKLFKILQDYSNPHVVLEATGGYEKLLVNHLHTNEIKVSVVNPRQVRDFAKASGKLAKTDKIDAFIIALFGQKMEPKPATQKTENQQKLAELHARRKQLVDMIVMEKNRLDKTPLHSKKSIQRIIKALEKELETINQEISEMIMNDPEYAQKLKLLRTVKGVGAVIAAGILAHLPELGQLDEKQIVSLSGLAPFNCDSGNMRGKRVIWGGRAPVRCILFMATIVAIRHNKQIKPFYDRLCAAGKPKMVAITACMRKLLIIMNAMLKNNQPFRNVSPI
jgi:transposase